VTSISAISKNIKIKLSRDLFNQLATINNGANVYQRRRHICFSSFILHELFLLLHAWLSLRLSSCTLRFCGDDRVASSRNQHIG